MTNYQIYVFFMCLIVFVLLASLSIFCIYTITKLTIRLIRHGAEDEKILKEHKKKQQKKHKSKYIKVLDYAFSGIVCVVLLVFLVGSLVIQGNNDTMVGDVPVFRVVNTGSMAKKNEKNTYLEKNKLDNQIQTFDLIRTEKLPDEMDLKLYDIVVYETDGMLIVHRIVEIEEPNSNHPNCRHFKLQGDAVEAPDRFPVLYEQMRAIYRGERIPFIGSFVLFMQSPAGWLCALYVLIGVFAMPMLEAKLQKEKDKRLLLLLQQNEEENKEDESCEAEAEIEICEAEAQENSGVIVLRDKKGKMGEVNLDCLDARYENNSIVDISSLKEKSLIEGDCERVKVLSEGEINKPLTVKAHSFDGQSVEAIRLAGGRAILVTKLIDERLVLTDEKKEAEDTTPCEEVVANV